MLYLYGLIDCMSFSYNNMACDNSIISFKKGIEKMTYEKATEEIGKLRKTLRGYGYYTGLILEALIICRKSEGVVFNEKNKLFLEAEKIVERHKESEDVKITVEGKTKIISRRSAKELNLID